MMQGVCCVESSNAIQILKFNLNGCFCVCRFLMGIRRLHAGMGYMHSGCLQVRWYHQSTVDGGVIQQ